MGQSYSLGSSPISEGPTNPKSGPLAASVLEMRVNNAGRAEWVGPYRVLGMLGKGGMGVVYEVEHETSKAHFALKTIETRFLKLEATNAGRRFTQEIGVLKKLDHPGVVRLYDYGFAKHPMGYELAFFVMEQIVGETLEARLKQKSISVAEALSVVACVTEALGYLGEHSVLHRDIKPANMMVEADGRVVLMDFGLARSQEFTRLTQAGHIIGTLGYMSPEALRGDEKTSIASDVFALGAVLYEMLTGEPPFMERDPTSRVRMIRRGLQLPDDFDFGPHTEDFKTLLFAMLAYKAEDRPRPEEVTARAEQLLVRMGGAVPSSIARASTRAAESSSGLAAGPVMSETKSQLVSPQVHVSAASAAAPQHSQPGLPAQPVQPGQLTGPQPSSSDMAFAGTSTIASRSKGPGWFVMGGLIGASAGLAFAGGFWVKGLDRSPQPKVIEVPVPVPVPVTPKITKAQPVVMSPQPLPVFIEAEHAYQYGDKALRDKQYHVAIRALEKALKLNPAHAKIYRRLGDAHLSVGELDAAKENYKTYIALRPSAKDAEQVRSVLEQLQPGK